MLDSSWTMTARLNVFSVVSDFFSTFQLIVAFTVSGSRARKRFPLQHRLIHRMTAYMHKPAGNAMFHQWVLSVVVSTSARTSWFQLAYRGWVRLASSSSSQAPKSTVNITVNTFSVTVRLSARCQHYMWTLQQDSTLSHTARNTVTYLRHENVTFIEPDMWPPNSPDLNPVDYAVCLPFNRCCYRRQWFTSVEQLKRAIITEWGKLSHFVDRAKLVTGSSTSSSSKDTLNIWYEDCRRLWLSNLVTECSCPI